MLQGWEDDRATRNYRTGSFGVLRRESYESRQGENEQPNDACMEKRDLCPMQKACVLQMIPKFEKGFRPINFTSPHLHPSRTGLGQHVYQ